MLPSLNDLSSAAAREPVAAPAGLPVIPEIYRVDHCVHASMSRFLAALYRLLLFQQFRLTTTPN